MSEVDEMRVRLLAIPPIERVPLACCEKCICFRQVAKTEYGNCHFDPPAMYYDELTCTRISAWPEVHIHQWCKKFEGIVKE
jgi:hypothetical protein